MRQTRRAFVGSLAAVSASGIALTMHANRAAPPVQTPLAVRPLLKGANPGSLPIQVADTLDLALNLTMAHKIGLTFPESVLLQATEIIQ